MQKTHTDPTNNVLAEILSQVMMMGIIYGLPIMLMLYGGAYIITAMQADLSQGVRSLAAAVLPLMTTLAFYRSSWRDDAMVYFSENKLVAFGIAFVLAMVTSGVAMFVGNFSNVPIAELVFSATLALMVFGTDVTDELSFLHVGAVSGFLTYIIIFGIGI